MRAREPLHLRCCNVQFCGEICEPLAIGDVAATRSVSSCGRGAAEIEQLITDGLSLHSDSEVGAVESLFARVSSTSNVLRSWPSAREGRNT